MIKKLIPLLAGGAIALVLKAEAEGQVRITFTQKANDTNKVPIPALSIVAKADDIEAELIETLTQLSVHREGEVASVLAIAKQQMDEAAAAVKAEAEAKRTSAKSSAKPAAKLIAKPDSKLAPSFDDDSSDDDADAEDDDNTTNGAGASADAATPAATTATPPAAAAPSLFD